MGGYGPPRRKHGSLGPSHGRMWTPRRRHGSLRPSHGRIWTPTSKIWFPGSFQLADIDLPRLRHGSLGPSRGRTSIPSHVEDMVPWVLPMGGHRSPTSKTWFPWSFPWTDINPLSRRRHGSLGPSHGRTSTPTSNTWFPWVFPRADINPPTSKTWFLGPSHGQI